MKVTKLGKNGPKISTVGFGSWAIGGLNWGKTDDSVSKQALHKALDEGVTFFDTADVYGLGHAEILISEVLKERGKGDAMVATKAGNDFYSATAEDDQGYGPIKQNYDKAYLIQAAEQSLKRTGYETLDLLQLHSPDTAWLQRDDPWEALTRLKQDGKIRYAGWSVQSFQETEQAFILDEHHDILDCIQVRYNLLEREAEKELFPKAQKYGIGVIIRIPILFGLLAGKFNSQTRFGEDDHRRFNLAPEKLRHYLEGMQKLQPLFDAYPNYTKAQVSLAFCISHPACHTVIPGAKTPIQVAENCVASELAPIDFDNAPKTAV